MLFLIASTTLFAIARYYQKPAVQLSQSQECIHNYRLSAATTSKTVSVFRQSLLLLVMTLLEISSWAFLFAWRLESVILEKSAPLFQVIDPGLAFIPRVSNLFSSVVIAVA
jgi:hypothetical protein